MSEAAPRILPPPPLPDGSEAPPRSAEKHDNLVRFQSELEFLQCLANPQYLHELFNLGYFSKPGFVNYLQYLEYWRDPQYVRFIVYPTCLVYLTLLQTELFRMRLGDATFIAELMRVGTRHHMTWRAEKPPEKVELKQEEQGVSGLVMDEDDQDEDEQDLREIKKKRKSKKAKRSGI